MDATPRGVGDERPAPQGRGAAATGTRDEGAPVDGAAESVAAEAVEAVEAVGAADALHALDGLDTGEGVAAEEARRGERMGRAERVRRAVEADGPAGVLGGDLAGGSGLPADGEDAEDARTHDADADSYVDAYRDSDAGAGGAAEAAAADASDTGDDPATDSKIDTSRVRRGSPDSAPLPRRERRPGRVEYPWRLARFDDGESDEDERGPEFRGRSWFDERPSDGPVFERFGTGSFMGDEHGPNGRGGSNGHASHGHGSNGAASDGAESNGAAPNGAASKGEASNGAAPNGHSPDGLNGHGNMYEQPVPEPELGASDEVRGERTAPTSEAPKGASGAPTGPSFGAYAHDTVPSGPNAVVQLAVGDHLLTVGGPDGSEAVPLPATSRPVPVRAPVAPRSTGYPPLGRQAEIAELRGLLARGTSVRVGGPAGIGRSTLLKYLASGDAAGAPDGVVVLSGHGRGLDDLLQQFHDACFTGERYRPTRAFQAELLSGVAALVVIDDLDLSPGETEELLRIAPECVFLVASKSSADAETAVRTDTPFFEITLGGLPQEAAFALLARAAGRELDDEELGWAAALWFEVDGHPGRFAQAGALLARLGTGVVRPAADFDDEFGLPIPELPSPGEPRLFVPRLVPLLSRPAQQVLRLGAALDGVLPDPAHLPALTGAVDAHGAAAELVSAGLVVVENRRHRLAGGVVDESVGVMRGPSSWAVAAIQHFTWWASHPTVTPVQVAEEADVILACLREVERLGKLSSVRVLARAAAPAFASALRFEAWRDCLEIGAAAAAASGAVGEQAWFRHELAVLALCLGDVQRAREEATAAMRSRDASDKRGLAADRRILVLSGERPGAFSAPDLGSAALGRRRAMSASMAGKRGVMTLGAAGVLVVTLAVVVAFGSDEPGSGGGPGTDGTVSVSDVPVGNGGSPHGAPVPPASHGGRGSAAATTGASESATPSGIRSTPASKSPSATATTRGATTPPATPPGQNPGPGPGPVNPPTQDPPPESSPPSSTKTTPPTSATSTPTTATPTTSAPTTATSSELADVDADAVGT
ncbi:hypothetical protein [Yinghuangia sp. YIM S09857]|uniref:hypothetical protein n=1 Tax=Yinghuangia sp. YIM S09857 TaxID=3436929 RepID=UPI003F537DDC